MAKRTQRPKAKPTPPPEPVFMGSFFSYPPAIDPKLVKLIRLLEAALNKEVWLVVHHGPDESGPLGWIDFPLLNEFIENKSQLPAPRAGDPPIALLIHSGGGKAEPAYRIAKLINRRSGGFQAIVPKLAKSAATLLTLGASSIVLGEDAELGPLDAQFFDFDVEENWVSALDEVQAVEALEQSAIDSAWHMLLYLSERTKKRVNTLLPHALHFAAEVTKPLFEKIDTIRYSRYSRVLQEAQDYAERLMRPRLSEAEARAVARDLVRNFPTHGFVIDREESRRVGKIDNRAPVGLPVIKTTPEIDQLLDECCRYLDDVTIVGKIIEVKNEPGK